MPKRDEAPIGAPCWIDIFTSDPDRTKAFYGELFGWTSDEAGPEFGNYINFAKDGIPVAGGMRNDGTTGQPDGWNVHLATANAQKTADLATANGGTVIVPPMTVGELGTMLMVLDAGGVAIGAWQPGLHRGFGVLAEPGAPSWFELHTREYDKSVAFYKKVFGWNAYAMSDAPEFRYTTLDKDDDAKAGIMDASAFLPAGVPGYWSIYFGSDNTDTSLKEAVALGATVVQEAEDTPYGRLASATDPTGARFKLVQS